MGRTLLKIELEKNGEITVSSDMERLDAKRAGIEDIKAAFFSYVPAFCAEFRRLPVKVSYLTSMLAVIFLTAAMAVSDNGDELAKQFQRTYEDFKKGRKALLKATK